MIENPIFSSVDPSKTYRQVVHLESINGSSYAIYAQFFKQSKDSSFPVKIKNISFSMYPMSGLTNYDIITVDCLSSQHFNIYLHPTKSDTPKGYELDLSNKNIKFNLGDTIDNTIYIFINGSFRRIRAVDNGSNKYKMSKNEYDNFMTSYELDEIPTKERPCQYKITRSS